MDYIFETRIAVRDYECDIQGIVNNANYMHYTEHTRHLFLRQLGLSFADLHRRGIDAVAARMNMQFKIPLRGEDIAISRMALRKEGLRYVFTHHIFRESDERLCFRSDVEIVTVVDGKLSMCDELDKAFERYIAKE